MPAQFHEHWGDTWRWTVERTGMEGLEAGLLYDPLCKEELDELCQSPPKWPPAGYWCALLTKLSGTDSMRVAWGPDVLLWDLCSQTSTMQLDWHMPVNTRIGRSAIGAPFSSGIRPGLHWAHVSDLKESVNAMENIMLPTTSSSMTFSVVGQWWSGEEYPSRVTQTSIC